MSFNELFKIIQSRMKWVTICTILSSLVAFAITELVITPKYSAKTQLLVKLSNEDNNMTFDVNTNLLMINTYKDLITGDYIIDEVKSRLESLYHKNMTANEIRESITISQSNNSQMFSIKSETDNPKTSMQIANLSAEVFQEKVKNLLKVEGAIVISKATLKSQPVSPNKKINVLIGLLVGLLIGTVLSIVTELLDGTVKHENYADELGVNRLGIVSFLER